MVANPKDVSNFDLLAKSHLLELQKANMPDWPESGFGEYWEPIIDEIENYTRKLFRKDKEITEKKLELIADKIKGMYGQYPKLEKLLKPKEKIEVEESIYPELPKELQFSTELAYSGAPWVNEYVAFSKKWSPRGYEDYHEAVAFALLSTVAGRRVSLSFGDSEYTPLFIALVGNTTFFKKTTTAKLYHGTLHAAGLDWMLGANVVTPQKLLSNMAGKTLPANWQDLTPDQQTRIKKRLSMAAQLGWYYPEFGMHLDAMVKENGVMAEFKGILRLLDDCHPVFEYDTHKRGLERIEKPYVSLLVDLTPADIKPYADKNHKFWRDGLFPRIMFTCPPRDARAKRDLFPDEKLIYPGSLTMPLAHWHQWLGEPEVEVDEEFGKDKETVIKRTIRVIRELPERECILPSEIKARIYAYENALFDMMEGKQVPEALFGSYGRFHKMALRACMLLASIDNQGYIELRHWARAQQFVERRRRDLHELFAQTNTPADSASAELEEEILRHMNRLASKGKEWVTANGLRPYMPGKSREEIDDKLKFFAGRGLVEQQKTAQATKYKLAEDTDE